MSSGGATAPPAQEQSVQPEAPTASVDGAQGEVDSNGHELFRLFVGGLPKHFHEADLRPMFSKYGSLKQVSVLREPDGSSKGCGFVLYDTREDAERAIAALDKNLTLPGQLQPMEVRFAKKPALVQPGTGPQDNRQLFFSGGPPGVTRKDVLQLFSYYGKVDHVHLFMDFRTKSSKGCGFVTFSTRKAAEDAMKALDQTYTMPGARMVLTVRWADPDLQERKRRAAEGLAEDQRQLFVAKVLKSSPEEDVQQLFSHYGPVEKVSMFKPAPDAVFHKGCGVVTMARREDAEAALRALDETYIWPGMHESLVVKWMDADFNKRKRFEPPAPQFMSSEPPPPGCDPDAIKLYVGNIPTSYSVDDIRQVFKQYGRVIQILIARDKETHQPKGSAYVWFQRRRESELSIRRLNGIATAMPDPANPHAKPLLVTVAQQSVAPAARPGLYGGPVVAGAGGSMGAGPMGGMGLASMGGGGGMGGIGGQHFGGPVQQQQQQQQMPPRQPMVQQAGRGMGPPQQAQQGQVHGGYGGEEYYDQAFGPASYDPNAYYDGAGNYGPATGVGGYDHGSYDQGGYGAPLQQQGPQPQLYGGTGGAPLGGPQGGYAPMPSEPQGRGSGGLQGYGLAAGGPGQGPQGPQASGAGPQPQYGQGNQSSWGAGVGGGGYEYGGGGHEQPAYGGGGGGGYGPAGHDQGGYYGGPPAAGGPPAGAYSGEAGGGYGGGYDAGSYGGPAAQQGGPQQGPPQQQQYGGYVGQQGPGGYGVYGQ